MTATIDPPVATRSVNITLWIGVIVFPFLFAWLLLQRGYSSGVRLGAFSWMGIMIAFVLSTVSVDVESREPIETTALAENEPANAETLHRSQESSATVSPTVETAVPASEPGHEIEACMAAVAIINDRDPATFTGAEIGPNLYHVQYRRPDDGTSWQNRCQIVDGNRIVWAAYNAFGRGQQGRWRYEDEISYSIEADQLNMRVDQSGFVRSHSYPLSVFP